MIIPYCSWTGTKTSLRALRQAGWRVLTGPPILMRNAWAPPKWDDGTIAPFGLDNGAWTAHQQEEPFDAAGFEKAFAAVGRLADWVVVPDIVGGGADSLEFTTSWLPRLQGHRLLLVAVQDGMEPDDVASLLGPRVGVFLGGTTEWKLSTMDIWGQLTKKVDCHYHVGRVNTVNRIMRCKHAGADSIDGTSVTRFACNLPRLDHACRQLNMFTEK